MKLTFSPTHKSLGRKGQLKSNAVATAYHRTQEIRLYRGLFDGSGSIQDILRTLLHEFAHLQAPPRAGHYKKWAVLAGKLGASRYWRGPKMLPYEDEEG